MNEQAEHQVAVAGGALDDAASVTAAGAGGATDEAAGTALEAAVVEALKTVYDPEIPVNIYELGLIYDLTIDGEGDAWVKMTLTSPNCPVAGSLPGEVQAKVASVAGIRQVELDLVWDPAWNPEMMSEAAKLELGFF